MISASLAPIVTTICHSVSQCENYDTVPQAVLLPVARRLGASAGAFFQIETLDGRPTSVERGALCGPFNAAADLYRRDLFREDPLLRSVPGAPILLSDMLGGPGNDERIAVYRRDFLLEYGIGDIIGMHFKLNCGAKTKELAVSFQRTVGMGNYTREDMELLSALVPTLRLALSNLALETEVRTLHCRLDGAEPEVRIDYAGREPLQSDDVHSNTAIGLARPGPNQLNCLDSALMGYGLTRREIEIADALLSGHSNPSMANSLGISVRTIENHLRSIYAKAMVNSRTQFLAKLFTRASADGTAPQRAKPSVDGQVRRGR
jgi:DNA-binding CsgD family transcriptional regulator